MNRNELVRGINRAWHYIKSLGVEQQYICPASLNPSEEFIRVAFDPDAIYEDLYLCGLRQGDYNILLADYSYLQFSMADDDNVRYAYYPNPFIGASTESVRELSQLAQDVVDGLIDMEEYLHRVSEIRNSQHPPLVRYENSREEYRKLRHPCSHLHFGHHGDNRWAVRRVLTPHAFVLVILKHFYPDCWDACRGIDINNKQVAVDDVYSGARSDCRILPDHLFAPEEGSQFHFA